MSIHRNVAGTYKRTIRSGHWVGGVEKRIDQGWVNVGGVWKRHYSLIPDELIALFGSTPGGDWKICNGTADPLDLIGMYFRGSNAEGSATGSNTHDHASSGFGNTGDANNTFPNDPTPNERTLQSDDHVHSTPDHGHSSVNHEPLYYEMIPAVAGKVLPANTLLFYDGAVAPSGWTAFSTVYDKFIKCAASGGGSGGAASHSHPISGIWTGYTQSTVNSRAQTSSAVDDLNHRHSADHTHTGGQNYPAWHGLLPVRCNFETGYIPSGIVAFFKGSVVPDGWTLFTSLQDAFLHCKSTSGGTGGADTHIHSHSGMYTGSWGTNQSWAYPNGDYLAQAHSHAWPGGNHASGNNLIYHRPLLVCKKD